MKLGGYSILSVEQKPNGNVVLFWMDEYSIAHCSFSKKQIDIFLKQVNVPSARKLQGHTIIVIKSGNGRVGGGTKYVCIPKSARFQVDVKVNVVENNGRMIEAQAV